MLDSIWLSLAGMNAFSKGLRTISNNVANMNTPGFKKSQLLFEEQFNANVPYKRDSHGLGADGNGGGVNAYASRIDFTPGEARQTGAGLDMALDGAGYFVLRAPDGEIRYDTAKVLRRILPRYGLTAGLCSDSGSAETERPLRSARRRVPYKIRR